MAIYHLSAKVVQRSRGRSATAAAAYRAAEIIACEREGRQHDYTRKRGVDHTEIVGWSGTREALWNAAETAEKRKDATTAREYEVALPVELDEDEQIDLARSFASWLHQRHGVAVDVALHDLDSGNPHAHILTSTRPVDAEGIALDATKAPVEWSDKKRKDHGLGPRKNELEEARAQWEWEANAALEAAGTRARIDHRSLKDQGTDRPAEQHEGPTIRRIEKKAQRRAERQGVEYQPVTVKGGMNHDAREIVAVERAISDLEDERIAAAAAEAADQERREADRQAIEAAQIERDSEDEQERLRQSAFKPIAVTEAELEYRSAARAADARPTRDTLRDAAHAADRVADALLPREPRPSVPTRRALEHDERIDTPVTLRKPDGGAHRVTLAERNRDLANARERRESALERWKSTDRKWRLWNPFSWRDEIKARWELQRHDRIVESAKQRVQAVENALDGDDARERIASAVTDAIDDAKKRQQRYDKHVSAVSDEVAEWRDTADKHRAESDDIEAVSRPKSAPESGPRTKPRSGPTFGM